MLSTGIDVPSQNAVVRLPAPGSADRLRRGCWTALWWLLYRPTPVFLHGWRRFLLRRFGARIGAGVHPYPGAFVWAPWNLTMEAGSCLANGVDCYNVAPVHVKARAVISQKTYLCTASHDFDDPDFPLIAGPITIGENAWVAASAFIGPGIEIGPGAVVLACAVVVADVPAQAVVAGNPAVVKRARGEAKAGARGAAGGKARGVARQKGQSA